MTNRGLACLLLFLFGIILSHAEPNSIAIKLSRPYIDYSGPAKAKKFDSTTKQPIDVDGFHYECVVFITNVSDKPVRVVTEGLSTGCSPNSTVQEIGLSLGECHTSENSLVIPTESSLGLVDLGPRESTFVKFNFTTTVAIERLSVNYLPQLCYNGRFGYWTGSVTSPVLVVDKK